MGRDTGPVCRQCRREGAKLFLKGARCYTKKCSFERRPTPPGMHAVRRRKVGDYGLQLREKQKMRRVYRLGETQFRRLFEEAERGTDVTGEHLLRLLVVNVARQFKHVFWPVKMHGNARVDRLAVLVTMRKMRECVGLEYNKRSQRSSFTKVSVATVVKERLQYTADVCFELLLSAFFCFVFFGIFCKNSAAQVVSTADQIIQN